MRVKTILALMLVFAVVLSGATKRVLFEHFTSTTCGPCASWEPHLHATVDAYDEDQIVQVDYHVWWPAAGDPFFEANEAPQEAAVDYYGITGVPSMLWDTRAADFSGISTYDEAIALMQEIIDEQLDLGTTVDLSIRVTDAEIQVTVDVEEAVSGTYTLRVMMLEDNLHYVAPNGLTDFSNTFREAYPDYDGTIVDLGSLGSETYNFDYTVDGDWDPTELRVIAFLQNTATQAVENAAEAAVPPPAYVFSVSTDEPTMSVMPDIPEAVLYGELENTGTEADEYAMSLSGDWPEEWSVSWCSGDLCMSAAGVCTTSLAAGRSEELSVHVGPMETAGEGTFTITVISVATGAERTLDFTLNVIGAEGDVLLISDGLDFGGSPVDNSMPYTEALDELEISYSVWNRADGPVPADFMGAFPFAIWFTIAGYSDVIDEDDVEVIGEFLDNGGTFWLASAEAAWDLSTSDPDFYDDYFHNTYDSGSDDECSYHYIHGTTDPWDAVADSLVPYDANFTNYMDILHPDGSSTPILYYGRTGTSEIAAFIYEGDDYNLIYSSFGFEYIAGEDTRLDMMTAIMSHFGVYSIEEKVALPEDFAIEGNYPNPFNPATEVVFTVDEATQTDMIVVDVMGRHVATLVDEELSAGKHRIIWDGRDDKGRSMPTGLYMIKLNQGDKQAVKTMILAK